MSSVAFKPEQTRQRRIRAVRPRARVRSRCLAWPDPEESWSESARGSSGARSKLKGFAVGSGTSESSSSILIPPPPQLVCRPCPNPRQLLSCHGRRSDGAGPREQTGGSGAGGDGGAGGTGSQLPPPSRVGAWKQRAGDAVSAITVSPVPWLPLISEHRIARAVITDFSCASRGEG